MDLKLQILDKMIKCKNDILVDYISFWEGYKLTNDDIKSKWYKYILSKKDFWISFYLHIPFCSRICKYCMYNTLLTKSTNEIDEYIESVINYLDIYKDIFIDDFNWIYVWWWTPSILSDQQIEKLFSYIFSTFKFNDSYYKTIELNPSSTDKDKLYSIKSVWFDRISLWVQSFNKETLKIENRTYVSPSKINLLVKYWKNIWFSEINLDIIFWMNNEWKKELSFNLKKLIDILPDSITVYTILKSREKSKLYNNDPKKFNENILLIYNDVLKETWILDYYDFDCWSPLLWFNLFLKNKRNKTKIYYDAHNTSKESLFWVWYKSYSNIWWVGDYKFDEFSFNNYRVTFEKKDIQYEIYSYILSSFQKWISEIDFEKQFDIKIESLFKDELKYLYNNNLIRNKNKVIYYIGDINLCWYYSLIFLDNKSLLKFIKNRFYEKK